MPTVVIDGSSTDNQLRREFVAGKIIIGRKRIEESGATNVHDLLKKEPAVTVGADGRLGLMGLPGHTQVLVDGVAPAAGKSPTELDVVHVERIEIVKSSLAEFGPYGMAGTINIISRKTSRTKQATRLRLGASGGGYTRGADFALSGDGSLEGLHVSSQVSGGAQETREQTAILVSRQGRMQQRTSASSTSRSDNLSASSTISWQADPANKWEIEPALFWTASRSRGEDLSMWADPDAGPGQSRLRSESPFAGVSMPVKWTFKPEPRSQLLIRFSPYRSWSESGTRREDVFFPLKTVERESFRRGSTRTDLLKLDYSAAIGESHDFKAGASISHRAAAADYSYRLDTQPDLTLASLGTQRQVLENKRSLFIQDDWRLSKTVAANVGISGEQRRTSIAEGLYDTVSEYLIWAPSSHLSWKLPGEGDRRLRISLARTFKAPTSDQLAGRPAIHPLAPCTALCGPNGIEFADVAGQPKLRPERAAGLNVSYEHYLGADSMVTLEAFARKLDDVVGIDIALESLPWSPAPRYVARPANLGTARIYGVSVEGQLQTREFWKAGPKLDLHGSAGLARSEISAIPGPDNRMAGQSPWRAKLGGNYIMADLPLKLSIDASWTPAGSVRTSATRRLHNDRRTDVSAQAVWTINGDVRARLSVDSKLPRNSLGTEELISGGTVILRETSRSAGTRFSLGLEMKL